MKLSGLETPRLVLDAGRMEANVARLGARLAALGVRLRPHVKTCKSVEVARHLVGGGTGPITVSTLREAEQFLEHGFTDILYAVGIAPGKLDHVIALRGRGADLAVVVDSVEAARAVAERGAGIPALIEVDCDGHRAGVGPAHPMLLDIAKALARGAQPRGVMTHAGGSYDCRTTDAIAAMAEQERDAVVRSAAVLRSAGFACPVVSVGSTPTATFARRLEGVTEVRAGVFVFQDLVMAGLGVCRPEDVALTVLVTVIGHQRDKGWIITDGGWMALSRDRGTARQAVDQGYGLVCDEEGRALGDLVVADANQEHGIVARRGGGELDVSRWPVGTRLRILPNHACATAAQHDAYHVVRGGPEVIARWPRFGGW
jgi:D-serine deaminase-like pyridoxal phosphate-dependent protein